MLLCCRQKCVNTLTRFKRMLRDYIKRANCTEFCSNQHIKGVQWLNGGVLDSRPMVRG